MLVGFAFLALAFADPGPARAEWYDCLDRYSQVAMLGSASSWDIAKDALSACSDERRAYQIAVLEHPPENGTTEDGPAFANRLAEDDRVAATRVMAFLTQNRRR